MTLTSYTKNGQALVASFALIMTIGGFVCAGSAEATTSDPTSHDTSFTIPLKRRRVPVKRKGQIVSHKTTYSGEIAIGSPLQHFSVVFDTGSGHVVLPGSECNTEACTVHRRYNRSRSSGAVDINIDKSVIQPGGTYDEITVNYGTGQIIGTLVDEKVCLGDVCTRMGIIKATQLSHNPFAYFPVDGIFGLGLKSLALDPDFSFFNAVSQRGNVNVAQFAMYIGESEDDSDLTVGGFDRAHMGSPVQWAPVAHAEMGYWQVDLKAIHIGDRTLDICKDGGCHAILDTGTSHLGVPSSTELFIENLLSTPAQQSDNCFEAQGKSITFELESFNLTLDPANYMRRLPLDDYVIGLQNATSTNKAKKQDTDKDKPIFESNLMSTDHVAKDKPHIWCRPLLMPVNLPDPLGSKLFILGEPLLRRYYTVFDSSTPALGFGLAQAKTPVSAVEDDTLIFMQQSATQDAKSGFTFVQVTVVAMKRVPAPPPKTSHEDFGTRVTILDAASDS